MPYVVDQIARNDARKALAMAQALKTRFEDREKAALEWRSNVSEKLDGVNDNIKALYNRNWTAAVGFIIVLLGVVGYLLDKHGL